MSITFERWLRNLVHGPYGRWVMLGLLIFILVIFTVTDEMTDFIRSVFSGEERVTGSDVAGSFYVLPGDRTDVTYEEYEAARQSFALAASFIERAPLERVRDLDVWTHLVLLEAARKEGVTVSNEELMQVIRPAVPDFIWEDRQAYRSWVKDRFRVGAPVFEQAVKDFLTAIRLRSLYWESYLVGPAITREEAVERTTAQRVELAFGDYAALDARHFLDAAAAELEAEADTDAKLREFFEKDPSVKLEDILFRHPRRYKLEVLYTIHAKVDTEEAQARIEELFSKAYPGAGELPEVQVKEQRDYYRLYEDRLLEMAGSSREQVSAEVKEAEKEDEGEPGEEEPAEEAGEEEDEPAPASENAALRQKMVEFGYQIVKDQIRREVWVRKFYEFLQERARDNVSLKEIYDQLKAHDDPQNPICSTTPGEGLIVYRDFGGEALTGDELQEIEDSGVKFGFSFLPRVTGLGDTDLPRKGRKADTLGDAGHGRQILRLLEVVREQRKTYSELTEGEKEDLRRDFYLPMRAREKAREQLEALRKSFVDGERKPEEFPAAAAEVGARVREAEWIRASFDLVAEPVESQLWPEEYRHMRDRRFLRKTMADVLNQDRVKQEYKAGTFLPVAMDLSGDADDPGAAYLFYLRERKKPDADTIPPIEIATQINAARQQRRYEEQQRWLDRAAQLISDFRMVFHKDMQARIDDELKQREEARRLAGAGR